MSIAIRKKSEIIALAGNLRLGKSGKDHGSKHKDMEFSGKLLDTSASSTAASPRFAVPASSKGRCWCRSLSWKNCSSSPIRRTC